MSRKEYLVGGRKWKRVNAQARVIRLMIAVAKDRRKKKYAESRIIGNSKHLLHKDTESLGLSSLKCPIKQCPESPYS